MFKFLKEKISNWTKKISKKKAETHPSDTELKKEPEKLKEPEKSKKAKKQEKEIKVPMKFSVAKQKFEPDLEKIEEIQRELEKPEIKKRGVNDAGKESKEEKEGFFSRLKGKISKVKITEEDFAEYSEDLRMLLLENNVAFEVSEKIIAALKEMIVGKELLKKEIESYIRDSLRDIIEEILIEPFDILEKIKGKSAEKPNEPYVILFIGINGTGKTTTIAKVASLLSRKNVSCVIAAADTFRAASIEQIKTHGEKIGIKVISQQYGSDPAAVGFDAISYAKRNHINVVLIDTAGRMHTAKNLMKELEKVANVCKPDLKLFIGESITGNDAVSQVKEFNAAIGIDGIILAKADVDEKGGTALSVGYITKKPILFLGTGQEYEALEPFDKRKFTERIGL